MFDDTITIYQEDNEVWSRIIVNGVQWSERSEKNNDSGKISVAKYIQITFPQGTYEGLRLNASDEATAIFYGVITEKVTNERGSRIGDLMSKHSRCGRIAAVNGNDNRTHLKNIKVILK